MGFLDNFFGPSDNTTTTKTDYPKWVDDAGKANYGIATQIASRPYTPYPWQRIAGFSGDQKDAMGMLRDASGSFTNAGNFGVPRMIDNIGPGGDVKAYMNPYVDNVLDRTSMRIRDATDAAKQFTSNADAHGAGAFGDARHGISDALIEAKGMQQMGDASAQGYAAAYDNAQGLRTGDINRMYQTEQVNQSQNSQLMDYINSLYRSGANQQSMDQAGMDLGYQDFLRQQNYPIDQYNILTAALNGSPYATGTSSTQPGPSTAGQIGGGLLSLLGLFK
jgi:hypothetical protein